MLEAFRPDERPTMKKILDDLRKGRAVILSSSTLDMLQPYANYEIRSAHNTKRVGLLDQYVCWIGEKNAPKNIERRADHMAYASL